MAFVGIVITLTIILNPLLTSLLLAGHVNRWMSNIHCLILTRPANSADECGYYMTQETHGGYRTIHAYKEDPLQESPDVIYPGTLNFLVLHHIISLFVNTSKWSSVTTLYGSNQGYLIFICNTGDTYVKLEIVALMSIFHVNQVHS